MKQIVGLSVVVLLGACINVALDEEDVFIPQPVAFTTDRPEQLKIWGEERFDEPGQIIIDVDANGETLHIEETDADFISAEVTHGFLSIGTERVAWTQVRRRDVKTQRPLVVHCGGNASDRYNSGYTYARKVLPYGDVLIFDYPGYGDSTGTPSAAQFEHLKEAVGTFALEQLSDNQPLVFWGHSLGGFVCAQIAGSLPETDGMVFETSALNVDEVAKAWVPWHVQPFVRIKPSPSLQAYDNARALTRFSAPILVIGAGKDKTLPVSLSRSLSKALKSGGRTVTYLEFRQANHLNTWRADGYGQSVDEFFKTITP